MADYIETKGYLEKIDLRDYHINKNVAAAQDYPEEFSLETSWMKVKNQGHVSSCVAHAMSTILEYHMKGEVDLSTNFIYGIQNKLCGHDGEGMYLNDALKIAKEYGDMMEVDCGGNTEVPKCWEPAEKALEDVEKANRAKQFRIKSYYSCKDESSIKYALMNYGPLLIAVKWYDKYKIKDDQLIFDTTTNYGGHAMVCYGWNKDGWLIQNSWGRIFAGDGRFVLPYSSPFREAKGVVDMPNEGDIVVPSHDNKIWDFILKLVSAVVNFLRGLAGKLMKKG